MEGQFSADETAERLEKQLKALDIPVFAKFDHAKNAAEAGLELRPTTVLVFGAPKVGDRTHAGGSEHRTGTPP